MVVPLSFMNEGTLGRVVAVNLSREWQHRLAEMGIRVGEEIIIHRVEKGSIIIEHNDSRWVIGRGVSTKIDIDPTDD